MSGALDCIIIGSHEINVHTRMMALERMKHISGAYFPMTASLAKFRGRWIGAMDLLNTILQEASGKKFDFHILDLPNLAVCYLTSYLLRRDFHIEAINFFDKGKDRLADLLRQGPRAVAISTSMYGEETPIQEVVQFIRKHNDETRIIVGGPYIFTTCSLWDTTTQDHLFAKIGADIYIYDSQGERTLESVLRQLRENGKDLEAIPNLIYRDDQKTTDDRHLRQSLLPAFVRTPRAIEDNDVDLNAIDWQFFPKTLYSPTTLMRISRGCPFSCAFCTYPVMGGAFKPISLDVLEREMQQFAAAGVRNIIFIDDTFNASMPRFKKILGMMIQNRFDFKWHSMLRIANTDDETFDLLQESGCVQLQLGIESGSQRILDDMDKRATVEQYRNGIRRARERGIRTVGSCIVGYPGETQESCAATQSFIQETQPTYYFANLYFHSNNAPIARQAEKFGLKGSGYSWRHRTMDWQEAWKAIAAMFHAIEGPLLPPHHMFYTNFAPPYLVSKGLSQEHINEFFRLWQPLIMDNLDGKDHDYQAFFALAQRIVHDLKFLE